MSLVNGADACNLFWQVGSSATLGTATAFQGTILALTSITLNTGATIEDGRALARNGAVTLDTNVITGDTCASTPAPTPPPTATPTPAPTATPTGSSPPAGLPDTSTAGGIDPHGRVISPLIFTGLLSLITLVLVKLMGARGRKPSAGD